MVSFIVATISLCIHVSLYRHKRLQPSLCPLPRVYLYLLGCRKRSHKLYSASKHTCYSNVTRLRDAHYDAEGAKAEHSTIRSGKEGYRCLGVNRNESSTWESSTHHLPCLESKVGHQVIGIGAWCFASRIGDGGRDLTAPFRVKWSTTLVLRNASTRYWRPLPPVTTVFSLETYTTKFEHFPWTFFSNKMR